MGLVIQNVSGSELDINDLGFGLANNATVDLAVEADALAVAISGNSGDLQALISTGDIVVKDPLDNTTNLSVANGLVAVQTHNDTHYRMPPGGRIADAIDVDLTNPGTYLRYTGTNFVRVTPADVASEIESELDITQLGNYIANQNIDWTVDQSPQQIDFANLPSIDHDALVNFVQNEHIDWTVDQSPLQIDPANVPVVVATSDQCAVTVGRTTAFTIPTSFVDLPWQVTFLENDTTCLEHDNTNTDRILIKDTGLYLIAYSISFDADGGEETISMRVRVNDTTVIPGGSRSASEDDEINDLSNVFAVELTAGDFISVQTQASGGGNTIDPSSTFTVLRASGAKGDKGNDGSGTATVQDEGIQVSGGPHSTLNFVGDGVTATDSGSGVATITIDGGGGTSVGGTSKRMNTWTLLSGSLYYNDFVHNLETTDVVVHLREFADNRQVEAEYTEIVDLNTVRVVVDGNAEDIVTNVVSGSGPQGIEGPPGPGAALTIQDEGASLTTDVAQINFTGAGVTVTENSTDNLTVNVEGGLADVVDDTSPQLGGDLDMNGNQINTGTLLISPGELGRLNNVTSNIQDQLNTKTTATGHTHIYRLPHTWGISGPIAVASGQTGYLLPMFISLATGQTARLSKCRYRLNDGGSVTFSVRRNGTDITGFTNITATTTATSTDPADVTLSEDDEISIVVTATSGTPQNLSLTIFIEYIQ